VIVQLAPRLATLLQSEQPRFSSAEMVRRRAALESVMAERDVGHLLIYGAQRAGGAVQWLTQWPVTTEAAVIVSPGRRDVMFVQFRNHVPQAKLLAEDAEVHWGGASTMAAVAEELMKRGAFDLRLGVMGPLSFANARALEGSCAGLVDLGRDFVRLRLTKSEEEVDWFRVGAALTDAGMHALKAALRPGVTEHQLADAIERAYVGLGGSTVIHYLGITSMADPAVHVPRQFTSNRVVRKGDLAMAELTASFRDYGGQVLRSFTVGPPSPLYRDLHGVAEAALNAITGILRPGVTMQEIVDASAMIEDAGFTTCDDLVHGFGGGYLPPVLGSKSRQAAGSLPDMTLEKNMMLVVQPNVITRDERAGVQTGELFLITANGCESLHRFPRGLQELV
jgi:Xaa-Pro dipeptidase